MKNILARWFTNLAPMPAKSLELSQKYDPERFLQFDTFEAIEVGRVKDIPSDYSGLMAVPISFLDKWNPEQFEIAGMLKHGSDGPWDFAKPILNGTEKYTRILIRKKS